EPLQPIPRIDLPTYPLIVIDQGLEEFLEGGQILPRPPPSIIIVDRYMAEGLKLLLNIVEEVASRLIRPRVVDVLWSELLDLLGPAPEWKPLDELVIGSSSLLKRGVLAGSSHDTSQMFDNAAIHHMYSYHVGLN
ncbi:hypothetical protein DRO02_07895, partial [archaeon]